jgi:hypothetical protein
LIQNLSSLDPSEKYWTCGKIPSRSVPLRPSPLFKPETLLLTIGSEKAFYDGDLPADDAVHQLYRNGVLITRIQRAFSLGMFGESKRRKLVPTRWSITAVDSNLSLKLMARVRHHPLIDEFPFTRTPIWTISTLDF